MSDTTPCTWRVSGWMTTTRRTPGRARVSTIVRGLRCAVGRVFGRTVRDVQGLVDRYLAPQQLAVRLPLSKLDDVAARVNILQRAALVDNGDGADALTQEDGERLRQV